MEHAEHPVPVPLVTAPGPVFVPSQSIARGMIAVAGTAPPVMRSVRVSTLKMGKGPVVNELPFPRAA